MTNNYSFQVDITDQSSWSLFYRLQSVFQNANPANPDQTFQAMQSALGEMNVVNHDQHENSPWRNRPAYLDDPKEQFQHAGAMARPLPKLDTPLPPKDWGAKSDAPVVPPKDWSKLGL